MGNWRFFSVFSNELDEVGRTRGVFCHVQQMEVPRVFLSCSGLLLFFIYFLQKAGKSGKDERNSFSVTCSKWKFSREFLRVSAFYWFVVFVHFFFHNKLDKDKRNFRSRAANVIRSRSRAQEGFSASLRRRATGKAAACCVLCMHKAHELYFLFDFSEMQGTENVVTGPFPQEIHVKVKIETRSWSNDGNFPSAHASGFGGGFRNNRSSAKTGFLW